MSIQFTQNTNTINCYCNKYRFFRISWYNKPSDHRRSNLFRILSNVQQTLKILILTRPHSSKSAKGILCIPKHTQAYKYLRAWLKMYSLFRCFILLNSSILCRSILNFFQLLILLGTASSVIFNLI